MPIVLVVAVALFWAQKDFSRINSFIVIVQNNNFCYIQYIGGGGAAAITRIGCEVHWDIQTSEFLVFDLYWPLMNNEAKII